jgi:hypothetical protein
MGTSFAILRGQASLAPCVPCAKSGDVATLAVYLGNRGAFDEAITRYALTPYERGSQGRSRPGSMILVVGGPASCRLEAVVEDVQEGSSRPFDVEALNAVAQAGWPAVSLA